MHCELQRELPFMQAGAAGDLNTRGNLEPELINIRHVLTVGSVETYSS